MNHRRASTGGCNMVAVPKSSAVPFVHDDDENRYPSSPEKYSGYHEEGDNSDDSKHEEIVTIITYDSRRRTTRRSSFSGPITRRRGSTGAGGGNNRQMIMSGRYVDGSVVVDPGLKGVSSFRNNTQKVNSKQLRPASPHHGAPISIQTSRGINPEVVARMSMVTNGDKSNNSEFVHVLDDDDDDDSEDELNSPQQNRRGYVGASSNHTGIDALYGLATNINNPTSGSKQVSSRSRRMERRHSNASSVHSRSSRTSQHRRSSAERRQFKSKDPLAAVNVYDNKAAKSSDMSMYDTDDQLENEVDDLMSSDDEERNRGAVAFGYESDAVSEHSHAGSISSSKRSKRRNSCIIPNGVDLAAFNSSGFLNGSVVAMANRSRDGMDMNDVDEDDDPDSLFNRAKRRSQSIDYTTSDTTPKGAKRITSKFDNEASFLPPKKMADDAAPASISTATVTIQHSVVSPSSSIDVIATKTLKVPPTEQWRAAPLTVSYAAPTEENLRANLKNMIRIDKFSGNNAMALSPAKSPKRKVGRGVNNTDNTLVDADGSPGGGMHEYDDDDDDDDDDESSYGASMYTDTMAHTENDYDMYQQKARRRASLENTHYDIDTVYQLKGIKGPNFKPAEGCRNASDFVVRCFTAKMRISGYQVLKHNRSRWSKAKNRIIYLLPDNQTLSWRECEEETINKTGGGKKDNHDKNKMKEKDVQSDLNPSRNSHVRGPKVDLSKCIEIRYACSIDPKNPKRRGTPVLRSRCKDELAGKSFSLIFANRTLDLTAFSNDQCKVLMDGFSALCFRIQLQKMESRGDTNPNSSDSDKQNLPDDQCTNVDVDDWASTMFGGSTTNTSSSNYVNGPTPWGR